MAPPDSTRREEPAQASRRAGMSWQTSIKAQLFAIVAVFVSGFALFLVLVMFSFRIATGVRAYVGGEGLWSKGQKDAVYYLQRYAHTEDPADFENYRVAIAITLGDRLAREELQKPEFDPAVVERAFLQGLNHPEDVSELIFLFRWFNDFDPMRRAIEIWTRADGKIEELERLAAEINAAVVSGSLDGEQKSAYTNRIAEINGVLTPLAQEFSATLSQAAREVRDLLLAGVLGTAAFVLAAGLFVSWRVARRMQHGLAALGAGVARVERGDFRRPIGLKSHDELGELARAFDEMMWNREAAERELRQRAEELARSNAELEQFAYVASHDLQEPLRTVASFSQLLIRRVGERLGEESTDYVHHLTEAVQRMHNLIADLLSYSRVTHEVGTPEPADLNALFDTALANLEETIKAEEARVVRGDLPALAVVPHLFVQLLQNLIGNAIKFRGKEAPRVKVDAWRQGHEWVFSVRDNGIGIDAEHFERIFVLFQRLHTRDRYAGSGLGLAICKKIVEQQGGRIWVEPASSGSDFRFTIPHTTHR